MGEAVGRSLVVGVQDKPPQFAAIQSASCPATGSCTASAYFSRDPNPQIAYGSLVYGSALNNDEVEDSRSDFSNQAAVRESQISHADQRASTEAAQPFQSRLKMCRVEIAHVKSRIHGARLLLIAQCSHILKCSNFLFLTHITDCLLEAQQTFEQPLKSITFAGRVQRRLSGSTSRLVTAERKLVSV